MDTPVAVETRETYRITSDADVVRVRQSVRNLAVSAKLTLIDQFDGTVELAFTQVKFNPPIEDSSFVFAIPPGAQVIKSDGL